MLLGNGFVNTFQRERIHATTKEHSANVCSVQFESYCVLNAQCKERRVLNVSGYNWATLFLRALQIGGV
jgi:hypothetical protein